MIQHIIEPYELPKVLIIGDSFTNAGGGGITMTNLFKGWPKDKIAVATTHVIPSGLDSCLQYYRLGYKESKRIWPLHYIQPKYESGPLLYTEEDFRPDITTHKGVRSKYNPRLKKMILSVFKLLGFSFLENRFKASDEFLTWLQQYNPDVIYTQLATYELIKFTQEIKDKTNIPVAVHIMDDWPSTLNKPGIFYYYWKYKLDHELRKVFDQSDILLSICDAMSREYETRYHRSFKAFHNPIVINRWLPFSKQDWSVQGNFKIIYTGRIGTATENALMEIAKAVKQLREEGESVVFDIFTFDSKTVKAKQIQQNEGVTLINPVSHDEYPALVPKYDLAVLPMDFDEAGMRFIQYSMPTKASEYMISGTPVLVYADKRTAIAQYAMEEKWGYVVTESNRDTVKEAIRKLMKDDDLRCGLGQTAREISIKNENAESVVQNFRNEIASCLNK